MPSTGCSSSVVDPRRGAEPNKLQGMRAHHAQRVSHDKVGVVRIAIWTQVEKKLRKLKANGARQSRPGYVSCAALQKRS